MDRTKITVRLSRLQQVHQEGNSSLLAALQVPFFHEARHDVLKALLTRPGFPLRLKKVLTIFLPQFSVNRNFYSCRLTFNKSYNLQISLTNHYDRYCMGACCPIIFTCPSQALFDGYRNCIVTPIGEHFWGG